MKFRREIISRRYVTSFNSKSQSIMLFQRDVRKTAVRYFRRCLLVFLFLGSLPMLGQVADKHLAPVEQSVQRLAHVGVFAFGGVGFAGSTSQGELDFRRIKLEPPDAALAAFEKVYATGNLQAKSYALVGIHSLKLKRFKELYAALSPSNGDVTTMRGCIVLSERFRDIARQIDKGKL